jgi:hypothetical protein
MLIAALLLAAAPIAPDPAARDLIPTSIDAVIAGAHVCAGTTTDPQGLPRRLAGWRPAPTRFARTDGQTFERDNVYVTVSINPRHPAKGACVVEARAEPAWKASDLIKALCDTFAARRQDALGRVILHLSGHEILVLTGAQRGNAWYVVLALAHVEGT